MGLSLQQEPTHDFAKCRESGYVLDDLWPTDRCGCEQMGVWSPERSGLHGILWNRVGETARSELMWGEQP